MAQRRIAALAALAGLCSGAWGQGPDVALIVADSTANANDAQAKLMGTGLFSSVTVRLSTATTPTLTELQQYDAVLTWSNLSFSSGSALGDVLADYVDAGGGVVNAVFVVSTTTANRFLAGRWDSSYQIIVQGGGSTTTTGGEQSLGTISMPGHPILDGVSTFSGGPPSWRPTSTALTAHGQLVAQWTDGKTLIAVSSTQARRADLGFVPYSNTVSTAGWNATTDGARLMANALLFVSRPLNACYANCDGSTTAPVLNVLDFGCFLNRFAAGDSYANCDGSTTSPVLNVLDFGCFLNSFAAGCP
jgi:hypothetical protein